MNWATSRRALNKQTLVEKLSDDTKEVREHPGAEFLRTEQREPEMAFQRRSQSFHVGRQASHQYATAEIPNARAYHVKVP